MQNDTHEIVICETCQGVGNIFEDSRVSMYESKTIERICSTCNGSGRLVKTITFEPYIERIVK